MMSPVDLQADCSNCAALCCVSLAFDKSKMFAINKANGEVCPNLCDNAQCGIHSALTTKGFLGCVHYSCHGAGQRVTQQVFGGKSWQDDAALLYPMMQAFETLSRVHELMLLLGGTKKLKLPNEYRQTVAGFLSQLNPQDGWAASALEDLELIKIDKEIRVFLKSLRKFVSRSGDVVL